MYRYFILSCMLLITRTSFALEPDKLFEMLSPSVWIVMTYDSEGILLGQGSSVVIGQKQLVTNCHVLSKAKTVTIRRENTSHEAKLLHLDITRDLCILQARDLKAPAVEIGLLKSAKIGQRVYALGAPREQELTFSDGLISSFIKDNEQKIFKIQTSVPIFPGSSGGGLINQDGKLVGITTASRIDAQNLNFAQPAEWISEIPRRSDELKSKLREEKSAQLAAAEKAKTDPSYAPGRQLMGEELRLHFVNLGNVIGKIPDGSTVRMGVNIDGVFDLKNLTSSGKGYTKGNYRIHSGNDQICLKVYHYSFKNVENCYRLFKIGEKDFALRSITKGYFINYSTN